MNENQIPEVFCNACGQTHIDLPLECDLGWEDLFNTYCQTYSERIARVLTNNQQFIQRHNIKTQRDYDRVHLSLLKGN